MIIKQTYLYSEENIIGKKTILRKLREEDLENSLIWFNDPSVNKYLSQNFSKLSREQEIQWFKFIQKSKKDMVFAIDTKDKYIHIGNCGLHKINMIKKVCELGIVIGNKNYWNKGYGSDAVKNLTSYALDKLNFNSIRLNVYEYNIRAIKVYKNCGFKIIKILKNDHYYDRIYWDTFVMELKKRF